MKNNQKGFSTLLSLLLFIVLAGGGLYLYTEKVSKEMPEVNSVSTTTQKENIVTIPKINSQVKAKPSNQTKLDNLSNGTLQILRTFEYQNTIPGTYSHLIFTQQNTKGGLLVEIMPPGVSGLDNFIISDNKIYFIANGEEATIMYFDILTGKFETVKKTAGKYGYISSIIPIDNKLIYIAGSKEFMLCLDLPKEKCLKANLYSLDLSSGDIKTLAENIKGSNLLGQDSKDNSIYFSLNWGDAGAAFADVYKYKDGTVAIYKSYPDLAENKDTYQAYQSFLSLLKTKEGYSSILLKNGKLLPGPEINEQSKKIYFFI